MKLKIAFLLLLIAILLPRPVQAEIRVDADFPGGNVKVESIDQENNVVCVRPDLRDTRSNYFYFYFRVTGAENRTVTFKFPEKSTNFGAVGPNVSVDGGKTWRFLAEKDYLTSGTKFPAKQHEFTWTFGPNDSDVRFAFGTPYTQSNWDEFMAQYRAREDVRFETLCRSRSDKRDVELFRVPYLGQGKPRFYLAFTARHHACESSASPVMEGMISFCLSDAPEAQWLRQNAEIVFIPFMDKDGVEEGDQGKNRSPHDHNRDYVQELYPSVKAFKALIVKESEGIPLVFMDLHAPSIRGGRNDFFYSHGPIEMEKMNPIWNRFRDKLAENQKNGTLKYEPKWDVPGRSEGHNSIKSFTGKNGNLSSSRVWVQSLPNVYFANCMEFGYTLCGNAVITPESGRELGRNVMKTLAEILKEDGAKEQ